ncbi:TPA: CfaE/CblD family pilus tip adhesin [Serratia fonticola]
MMVKTRTSFLRVIALGVVLFGALVPLVCRAGVAPMAQNTVINIPVDRMSLPAKLFIWDDIFGGHSELCEGRVACKDQDIVNSLICLSTTEVAYGACPAKLFWERDADWTQQVRLRFKHENGQTRELKLTSIKTHGEWSSWVPGAPLYHRGFTVYIPSAELDKLSIPGVWHAWLLMTVRAWDNCSDEINGCGGFNRAVWQANITLTVTDNSNQQIYLPAFPTSAPVINLNLKTRPGSGNLKNVSGQANLDMCLYDGNDSASNRISLRLQDEGAAAAGRPTEQFSVYRRGGDKSQDRDRLDYQVSVINPTTGASQTLSNGTEIIWSDTNRRNIQRQVILPGVSKPALCVPAPLTLTTPAFALSDKTAGDYTGTLRIIYTPTTQ